MKPTINLTILVLALIAPASSVGQNNVGINTNSPNSNSVLELVSPQSNQGFLVPRFSSSHRISMQSQLSFVDNGLMVYDSEENLFYYWNNNRWNAGLGVINEKNAGGDLTGTYPNPLIRDDAITEEKVSDGAISTVKLQEQSITTSKISDNAVTTNKLADFSVTGTKLEDVGITPDTYGNQFTVLKLTIDSKGRTIGVIETPILITSDHITNLSILNEDIANGTIRITKLNPEGNSNKVLIIDASGNTQWASREQFQSSHLLKDHVFVGNTNNKAEGVPVTGDISIESASFQINESVIGSAEIIDESIENEDLNKNQIPLSGFAPAVTNVNVGDNRLTNVSDPTDNQDGATKHYVDESIETLSNLDEDKDPFNELNTSTQLSGTSVQITDAGGTLSIDLDPTFATDTELATAISDSEALDLDKDATNELNTNAQLSGTSVEITDAGGTLSVDLDPTFATDTELASAISDSEALDLDKDATNELNSNVQLSGTSVEVTDAGGTLSVDLDPTFATDTELATAISDSEALDLDKDATNELNTNAQLSGTSVEVTDAGGTLSVDLDPTFATDTELATAISDSEALDLDKDATNELNTNAQLSGTSLEITDAGGTLSVDLDPTFATDTELATAISDSDALDLDKDATNELNTNAQLSGTSVEVTDAGGTLSVDLDPTFATDTELATAISDSEALDLDKDATNELNTNVQLSGTSVEVTDAGGTLSVDLDPTFATDTELASAISDSEALDLDKDATNELNSNVQIAGTYVEVTDAGGTLSTDLDPTFATDTELATAISDSEALDLDKDATNELNTNVQLSGTSVEITDAGGTLSVDLDPIFATDTELATAITDSEALDLDKDATNELNSNVQLSGTSVEVTDAGGTLSVDLDPTFATDTELATAISDSEALDLDKDATNELNTNVQLSGTSLEITDAGGTLSVDLDPIFATDTELATAITDSEALDLDKDATNELNTNVQLSGTSVEVTDAGGTLSVDLDPTFATDTELATAISDSEALDLDKDATNELNTSMNLNGTSLELTDAGGTLSEDLDDVFTTDADFYANMSSLINAFNEYAESIAFEAFLDESVSYISSGPIGFNQVVFEDGNDFYSSGHYFKAPKDGNYHFDAHLTVTFAANQAAAISIYVDSDETGSLDGSLVAKTQLYAHNGEVNSIAVAKTIKLEEGNRVYIRYDGPTSTVDAGRANTTFSGHIVK
ncbi:C1q-like domain-containing protein [Ekhidna sp.]|uniref:C1q-like domain-containing protein n=1 Tax=Ekhidna sp. TaxID=2608089 RepID=UPI003C7B1B3E